MALFSGATGLGFALGQGVNGITSSAVEAQNNFNASQAELQRQFEERMSNTAVQRAVADYKAAGLNPWLAVQSGGIGASTPSGAAATSNTASGVISGKTSVINTSLNGIARVATSAIQAFANLGGSLMKAASGAVR